MTEENNHQAEARATNPDAQPILDVAGSLDRIATFRIGLIEAILHSVDDATISAFSPDYLELERQLLDLDSSSERGETDGAVEKYRELWSSMRDAYGLLIWGFAGPSILRFAGHTDAEIVRICNCLGFSGVNDRTKLHIQQG